MQAKRPKTIKRRSEERSPEKPARDEKPRHPLFPECDTTDVAFIYVSRDGAMCATPIPADVLQSTADLYAYFGPGKYFLRARGEDNATITANAVWPLAGDPSKRKPLTWGDEPAAAPSPAPSRASSSTVIETVTAIVGLLTPLVTTALTLREQAEKRRAEEEEARRAREEARDAARSEREIKMFTLVLERSGGGGPNMSPDQAVQWMALGAESAPKEESKNSLAETVQAVAAGIASLEAPASAKAEIKSAVVDGIKEGLALAAKAA